jgi:hypothetical protein
MNTHDRDNVIAFGAPHDGSDDPVFEARLARALAVPVPVDLAERILLRQTTEARHATTPRRFAASWRAAAVLALAVGGLGVLLSLPQTAQALPELVVDHTLHHEQGATARTARIAPSQVRALFARRGVVLDKIPPEVTYANLCDLGADTSVHLVSREPAGPVTVYYVPGRVEPMRMEFERDGLRGRSVPMERGTLVMVAEQAADFDRVEQGWRAALAAR